MKRPPLTSNDFGLATPEHTRTDIRTNVAQFTPKGIFVTTLDQLVELASHGPRPDMGTPGNVREWLLRN